MPIPVVFSWGAGKDSAFGLWTLLLDPAYEVRALLTTLTEGYDRVSMSGVRGELLDRQADGLGLPLIKVRIPPACPNEVYEERMAAALASETFAEIDHVAFSDLFLEDVRAYREERLGWAGKRGVFPLGGGTPQSSLARWWHGASGPSWCASTRGPSILPSPGGTSTPSSWTPSPTEWTRAVRTASSTRSSGTGPSTASPSHAGPARSSPVTGLSSATSFRPEDLIPPPA